MTEHLVWVLLAVLAHALVLFLFGFIWLGGSVVLGIIFDEEFFGFFGFGSFEGAFFLWVMVVVFVKGVGDFLLFEKISSQWQVGEGRLVGIDKIKLRGLLHFYLDLYNNV